MGGANCGIYAAGSGAQEERDDEDDRCRTQGDSIWVIGRSGSRWYRYWLRSARWRWRRSPAPGSAHPISTYLALGDSISFGYSEQVFDENEPNDVAVVLRRRLHRTTSPRTSARGREVGRNLTLVNDACPGETSNGLIGEKEALGGKASTEPAGHDPQGLGDYHPCAYNNVDGLPLHNSLSVGGQSISQLRRRAEHPQRRSPGASGRGDHAEHRLQRRARGDQAMRRRSHRRIHRHREKQVRDLAGERRSSPASR